MRRPPAAAAADLCQKPIIEQKEKNQLSSARILQELAVVCVLLHPLNMMLQAAA
jgi:hypothetical protein